MSPLCAAIAANYARDLPYMVNAIVVMLAAGGTFLWMLRNAGEAPSLADVSAEYNDGVVRAGRDRHGVLGRRRAFWWACSSPSSWLSRS